MTAPVRVRYAPSPTGEPHLGNIRTALFNWLYARRHGGAFIVRVEDTDQERLVPGAMSSILQALVWLGLGWDEGPEADGLGQKGTFGPYLQSQRLPLYRRLADQLVAGGFAYTCFCSSARLEAVRRAQQQQKLPPGYDRQCRDLPEAERRRMEDGGAPSVVRFRVPLEGSTTVHDLVRGGVTWENRLLDDFIILKSDGFPTYHLASVADDHHMEISHVLRAEEWLPSTPRHLLLYAAFGWQPPQFAHLPMILGSDRSKLSKRHGATSVLVYREEGYLPDALVNFLALLGWSLDDKTEIIPRQDLIRHFSIERITKAGAVFNGEKLAWMNGAYIRAMTSEALAEQMAPFLERPVEEGGLPNEITRPLDRGYLLRVVPLVQERLRLLSESAELASFFFQEQPAYDAALLVQKGMDSEATKRALQLTKQRLKVLEPLIQPLPVVKEGQEYPELVSEPWGAIQMEPILRTLASELHLTSGQLFGTLRVAITGRAAAPPLFQTMEVLGKTRCLARLDWAIDRLRS